MEQENLSGEEYVEAAAPPENDEVISEPVQEETVPLAALQAERKQRQDLQQNLKMMQDHLELVKANPAKQEKDDDFGNLQDDDVLTVGDAKRQLSKIQNEYKMSVEELRMQTAHSDYTDVVKNYLPDVLRDDPDLRVEIENAVNPYKLAYKLAKRSDKYLTEQKKNTKNETAERILENANRPGSLSAVGSTAPKSKSGNWKSMSDKDFMAQVNRNMGYV